MVTRDPIPAAWAHIRRRGRAEALVGGGGNLVGLAQILGEALRAFQPCRPFGWAEGLDSRCFQIVDNARAQRHLGSDHDKFDVLVLGERDDGLMVGEVKRRTFGLTRYAGVAGRAVKLVGEWACGHLPGERVLTAAGTENEDVHETRGRPLGSGCSLV